MSNPRVTVQLPICNEFLVVEALLKSITSLDYPKDLLEIQVLDDSTDATTDQVRKSIEKYDELGFDIRLIHRANRCGFKAGALANALRYARGEFIAIFDADARPPRDFLKTILRHFHADKKLGMVQGVLNYWNRDVSLFTRTQALILDSLIQEQDKLSRRHLPFQFNGSGGVWRRECIEDVGGWSSETLVEDLDLSIRAQLGGWRFLQVSDVPVETELPMSFRVFLNQQIRWILGGAQVLRKLGPAVWRSSVPLSHRLIWTARLCRRAILHLSLMLGFLALCGYSSQILAGASVGALLLAYTYSLRTALRTAYLLPAVLLLLAALSIPALAATIVGLLGVRPSFYRTPKLGRNAFLSGMRRYQPAVSRDAVLGGVLDLRSSISVR